jgi:hypothetical protein
MLAALRSSWRAVAGLTAASARPASSLAAVEADQRPGGGGFLANLFSGGGGPGGVPLTEPLPGAPVVVPAPAPAAPPATQSSSLPNGATIAAEDTPVRRGMRGRGVAWGVRGAWEAVHHAPSYPGAWRARAKGWGPAPGAACTARGSAGRAGAPRPSFSFCMRRRPHLQSTRP